MADPVLLGVGAGAVALALAQSKAAEEPPAAAVPKPGSIGARIKAPIMTTGQIGTTPSPKYREPSAWSSYGENGWPQEVVDRAVAELKKRWEELSAEARKEACEAMKEEFPDDPGIQGMDCGATSFQQLLTVTAAAVGFYYGGPVGSAVAVIAVTVFGKAIENFLSDAWESIGHREGIGGPFEESYWHVQCSRAAAGDQDALFKVLTDPDAPAWCAAHHYNIPLGVKV